MQLQDSKAIQNVKFEDLGSIGECFTKFGEATYQLVDINDEKIKLLISVNEDIEIKILCSRQLSKIIKESNGLPFGIEKYRVLRIKMNNGKSYIRLSVNLEFDGDILESINDTFKKHEIFKGNKIILYKSN